MNCQTFKRMNHSFKLRVVERKYFYIWSWNL